MLSKKSNGHAGADRKGMVFGGVLLSKWRIFAHHLPWRQDSAEISTLRYDAR